MKRQITRMTRRPTEVQVGGVMRIDYHLSSTDPAYLGSTRYESPTPLTIDVHEGFEVGILLSGAQERHFQGFVYVIEPGDIWLCGTWEPHGWRIASPDTRDVVLIRDLRAAILRLNPDLPPSAVEEAIQKLTHHDFSRSLVQHNQEFYRLIRDGVPVSYRDAEGRPRTRQVKVIDFRYPVNNRFLAVRELKITGLRSPSYNRRADLVCFVNGLPLVFIELKAVHKNIRAGFDGKLRDYLDEHVIAHAFHHNAFLIVSNGHRARYGSITSEWDHFADWKRNDERDKGSLEAEVLLNGMLAKDRLLDLSWPRASTRNSAARWRRG